MVSFLLLVVSLASLATVPVTLFPIGRGHLDAVGLTGAPGTNLAAMSDQVAVVEAGLFELEGVERVATVVGTSTDNPWLPSSVVGVAGPTARPSPSISREGADVDALTTGSRP